MGTTIREVNVSFGAPDLWRAWETTGEGVRGSCCLPGNHVFSPKARAHEQMAAYVSRGGSNPLRFGHWVPLELQTQARSNLRGRPPAGQDLITATNSDRIASIPPQLKSALASLLTSPAKCDGIRTQAADASHPDEPRTFFDIFTT
jgi:hypothetical protein